MNQDDVVKKLLNEINRRHPLQQCAKEMFGLYETFLNAGFDEEQALNLMILVLKGEFNRG